MNVTQCLRAMLRPISLSSAVLRPQPTCRFALHRSRIHNQHRCISLLNPRRPILPCISSRTTLAAPSPTSSLLLCSPESLDIAGKISCHPGLQSTQIRCGPRDTYNPSHIVRKRRHGFLSRIRTKKGRKLLMRRLKKGRWNLSH